MEIRVQSIKFDAHHRLMYIVEKKLYKLPKFYDGNNAVEVTMSLLADHDNKNVKVHVRIPGNDIVIERNARKFEDALVDCVDILKDKLVRAKEKKAI